MPAPAGTKRVKGKRITRQFIIGSEAWPLEAHNRPSGIPDDHTTGWRVYVRNVEGGPDLSTWLNKVQFKIFQTYQNPNRIVESEPFQIEETGWGGFNVDIRLYFNPDSHEKPQYRQHFLQLERYGSEEDRAKQEREKLVRSEICDFIEFNEPTELFWDAMTSESQWDYLNKDKGKAKKGAAALLGSGTTGNNGEKSVELPLQPSATNPYSKMLERALIKKFRDAEKEVEKFVEQDAKKREELDNDVKELKEEEIATKKKLEEVRQRKLSNGEPLEPLGNLTNGSAAATKKK